mmetsp:Transcript_81048/g.185553  ORF Transcript_81048/g.185553 Transcript_81048/m.185553 type:complete len:104 (+) Transcript_81048:828-1139(+)
MSRRLEENRPMIAKETARLLAAGTEQEPGEMEGTLVAMVTLLPALLALGAAAGDLAGKVTKRCEELARTLVQKRSRTPSGSGAAAVAAAAAARGAEEDDEGVR